MKKPSRRPRFAICISAERCDDLTAWKLYQVLPDDEAAKEKHLRIVDDSGEDYLYPANRFVIVELSPTVRKKLRTAASLSGS